MATTAGGSHCPSCGYMHFPFCNSYGRQEHPMNGYSGIETNGRMAETGYQMPLRPHDPNANANYAYGGSYQFEQPSVQSGSGSDTSGLFHARDARRTDNYGFPQVVVPDDIDRPLPSGWRLPNQAVQLQSAMQPLSYASWPVPEPPRSEPQPPPPPPDDEVPSVSRDFYDRNRMDRMETYGSADQRLNSFPPLPRTEVRFSPYPPLPPSIEIRMPPLPPPLPVEDFPKPPDEPPPHPPLDWSVNRNAQESLSSQGPYRYPAPPPPQGSTVPPPHQSTEDQKHDHIKQPWANQEAGRGWQSFKQDIWTNNQDTVRHENTGEKQIQGNSFGQSLISHEDRQLQQWQQLVQDAPWMQPEQTTENRWQRDLVQQHGHGREHGSERASQMPPMLVEAEEALVNRAPRPPQSDQKPPWQLDAFRVSGPASASNTGDVGSLIAGVSQRRPFSELRQGSLPSSVHQSQHLSWQQEPTASGLGTDKQPLDLGRGDQYKESGFKGFSSTPQQNLPWQRSEPELLSRSTERKQVHVESTTGGLHGLIPDSGWSVEEPLSAGGSSWEVDTMQHHRLESGSIKGWDQRNIEREALVPEDRRDLMQESSIQNQQAQRPDGQRTSGFSDILPHMSGHHPTDSFVSPSNPNAPSTQVKDIFVSTSATHFPHMPRSFHHGASSQISGSGQPHAALPHSAGSEFRSPAAPPAPPIERHKIVDAASIFRKPGRDFRPDRFVVILRGLPGSGKTHLVKMLRDVETMNGGSAPRIHSMDDYFMAEVEKEDEEPGKTRGKRKATRTVLEYVYEEEMEDAYRASMLKAFKKTLSEGGYSFAIVDDRNILVAHFAEFWAVAKRSGYEVYILETPQIPPADCFARNVHNFALPQIEEMAKRWESTPPLYNLLNVSSLLHADELSSEGITEVEMDADDLDRDREEEEEEASPVEVSAKWSGEEDDSRYNSDDEETEDVPAQASTSTRWEPRAKPKKGIVKRGTGPAAAADNTDSEDDDDGNASTGVAFGNALFGLMAAYTKIQKQVRWADFEGEKEKGKGFRIGGAPEKKRRLSFGPGPGYNEDQNPEEGSEGDENELPKKAANNEGQGKIVSQLRAEGEAFRAALAQRRRQRIGLSDAVEEI